MGHAGLAADDAMGAVWIAVCAAAPEFIWRGGRLAQAHFDPSEIWAAILLGLVLAFFVEPLLERARHRFTSHRDHDPHDAPPRHHPAAAGEALDALSRRGAAFHALIGVIFAFCAVCLHDAMKALVSLPGHAGAGSGPAPAIALTLGWASTPFAIALAWRAVRRPLLCALFALLALAAPVLIGPLFDWSRADILNTVIPCTAILLLGLHRLRTAVPDAAAAVALRTVGQIAIAWLGATLLLDLALNAGGLKHFAPQSPGGFWMDVRFYAGWVAGLWLVPSRSGIAEPDPVASRAVEGKAPAYGLQLR